MDNPPEEQLRRLKNTVMGVGYRLAQLAKSRSLPDEAIRELYAISGELTAAAQRLERLLATLREGP